MLFDIEPLPLGSGVVFESVVPDDKIFRRYQAQVRQTLPEALRQGAARLGGHGPQNNAHRRRAPQH